MAVAVDSKAGSLGPDRSHDVDFATGYVSSLYNNTPAFTGRVGSQKKLILTSTKSLGHASSVGGSTASPNSNKQSRSRPSLRNIDTNMTSYSSTTTIPASTTRSESRLAKLHKRASSGSSLPATPSPLSGSQPQFTSPYATYDQSQSNINSTPSSSSVFKSRPHIRKLSSARDDENQGRLDLSKSTLENGSLTGLGIQDYGSRSASEVTFSRTSRKTPHIRNTSGGSQVSVASRSFTPTQPFVHPMRQTPNGPYTPSAQSYASSMNDEEVHESSDIVTEDDILVGQNFRNKRSMSISSTPQIQPTPLSQSYTAADLGQVPKLTSESQTNLSIRSGKSSKSKHGRSRRNTERSDNGPPPSNRNSVDKAFSFVSRRSDTEPQTRDEKIAEKRRQFAEREAKKERQELKRRETDEAKTVRKEERQRRKSEASQTERPRRQSAPKIQSIKKVRKNSEKAPTEQLRSRSYDETRPAQLTALPRHGQEPGTSEKQRSEKQRRADRDENSSSSGTWPRFSTWLQTRLLSCGGKEG